MPASSSEENSPHCLWCCAHRWCTMIVPKASPSRLIAVLQRSSSQSMARITARSPAYCCSPTACTHRRQISPAGQGLSNFISCACKHNLAKLRPTCNSQTCFRDLAHQNKGLTCSTSSMVTSPADGMAAAPMAASVAVSAMTSSCAKPSRTPCACNEQCVSIRACSCSPGCLLVLAQSLWRSQLQ